MAFKDVPWKAVAAGGVTLGVLGIITLASRKGKAPQSQRVALIGDSYAQGLGPELAKLLPDFRAEGRVGISTAGWMACGSCGDWLPAFKPAVTLVSLGVNDGSSPNSADYQSIVKALHGIGSNVVWIQPPAAVNAPAARSIIAALGVPVVPATRTPLGADHLHPVSYAPWASEVAQAVTT